MAPVPAVRFDVMTSGVSTVLALLLLTTSCHTSSSPAARHGGRGGNRTRSSSLRALSTLGTPDCYKFIRMFNMMTADGDLFVSAGDKVSPLQCQNACLGHFHSRVCVAAILRHGGRCLLAGYKLYPNPRTTHYRRLCRKGPACFRSSLGMETRFHTGIISIPPLGVASEVVAADICRRECEQLVFCVGFDIIENRNYCPYTEIRPAKNLYFTLYLRSC